MTTRILLVDDERLLRTGFSMILRSEPDLAVVGEAADGNAAVAAAAELHPDVILMDILASEYRSAYVHSLLPDAAAPAAQ